MNSEAVINATIESSDDENDETEAAQSNDDEQVHFVGLDALYDQMLALEGQLLCKGFQDKMGEKYDKIISPFRFFKVFTGGNIMMGT